MRFPPFLLKNSRVAWLLAATLAVVSAAGAQPVAERISFAERAEGGGYVVRLHLTDRVAAYSEPRYVGAGRLEVILFNTRLSQQWAEAAPAGPVARYDAQARGDHLYVTFEMQPGAQARAAAYRDRASHDLLISLAPPGAPAEAPAVPVRSAAARLPSMPAGAADPAPVGAPDPVLDDARSRWRLDTVVIDAGHGGHDTGAVGAGGLREKDVVLPVALRVGHLLEEQLGVRVVYTRRDDRFVTLRDRGRIANRAGGKLFVSIHANAAHNRTAHGTETFFLGLHKTEAAQHVMERENSVVRLEADAEAYAAFDQSTPIVQALAQSAYLRQSEALAALVQQQFTDRVGRENRGVKQAGFYVLWGASMPAVLVELGFVTNPHEAEFLRSADGQDHLAQAIFRAVRAFKADYERGLASAFD